jgi:hemerythrin-like domain-containing protein
MTFKKSTETSFASELARPLLRIIRLLRGRKNKEEREQTWHDVRALSATFFERLKAHLDHEERGFFPALEQAAPEHGAQIEELRTAHASLRSKAADLSARIDEGDSVSATDVADELLQSLVAHLRREDAVIDGISGRLPADAVARLRRGVA